MELEFSPWETKVSVWGISLENRPYVIGFREQTPSEKLVNYFSWLFGVKELLLVDAINLAFSWNLCTDLAVLAREEWIMEFDPMHYN